MQAPTIFSIAKITALTEQIKRDLNSPYVSISHGSWGVRINIEMNTLTNEIESLNQHKKKVMEYFGLSESNAKVTVEKYNSSTDLLFVYEEEKLEIKITSK